MNKLAEKKIQAPSKGKLLLEIAVLLRDNIRFTCTAPQWKRMHGQSYFVPCLNCGPCSIGLRLVELKIVPNLSQMVDVA